MTEVHCKGRLMCLSESAAAESIVVTHVSPRGMEFIYIPPEDMTTGRKYEVVFSLDDDYDIFEEIEIINVAGVIINARFLEENEFLKIFLGAIF